MSLCTHVARAQSITQCRATYGCVWFTQAKPWDVYSGKVGAGGVVIMEITEGRECHNLWPHG